MKPVLLRKTLAIATMAAVLSTRATVQAGVVSLPLWTSTVARAAGPHCSASWGKKGRGLIAVITGSSGGFSTRLRVCGTLAQALSSAASQRLAARRMALLAAFTVTVLGLRSQ